MLADSGSSKHFVDRKLVHRVETRMQDYTKISPPMEIKAAGHNTLLGIAQGTLLVVVRDTQGICRTVKLPIVLVPGLGRNLFSTAMAAQKGVKTTILKGRFKRSEFLFQNVRISGYVNTESIWSLQT